MVDFNDPTTWDQPLTEADAINIGIWAINTLQHPDASTDAQFDVLDIFAEGCKERLDKLRERLEEAKSAEAWVVQYWYNTDPEGKWVDDDDWSNYTLHGPFPSEAAAQEWDDQQHDGDKDLKDASIHMLNDPADRSSS